MPELRRKVLQYTHLKELCRARVAGMISEEEQLQAISDLIVSNMSLDDRLDDSPLNPLWRAIMNGTFSTSDARGLSLKELVQRALLPNHSSAVMVVKKDSIVEHLLRDNLIQLPLRSKTISLMRQQEYSDVMMCQTRESLMQGLS